MKRYVELGEKAEEVLDTTAAETLRKSVDEAHKNHGTKLLEVKRLILKNSPSKLTVDPKFSSVEGVTSDVIGSSATKKEPIKIKPLDCPT